MKKYTGSFLFIIFFYAAHAQPGLLAKQPAGIYQAGFRQMIVQDPSQNYPYFIDSSLGTSNRYPKPLLVNIWYPAAASSSAPRMTREEYVAFPATGKKLNKWMQSYLKYTLNTIAREVLRQEKELDQFNDTLKEVFRSFLQQKTTAIRHAKAVKGNFPVIFYHQGAGATFEDNSHLCEMLASNGYMVVGSSFQRSTGEPMSVGGIIDGMMDISFLLRELRQLPNADFTRTGMIGHSLGGQTVNYIAARGNLPIDAMVSLETTQEYFTTMHPFWNYFAPFVAKHAMKAKGEFLMVANPHTMQELGDKMINANRYYLTIPDIDHNDFITQGIQHKYQELLKKNDPASKAEYNKAAEQYVRLNTHLLAFFNAKLKSADKDWLTLLSNRGARFGHDFYYEQMPAQAKMETYAASQHTPTPRQICYLLQAGKTDSAIGIIVPYWKKDSTNPVFNTTFCYAMLEWMMKSDTAGAIKLYKTYVSLVGEKDVDARFSGWAKAISSFVDEAEGKAILNRLLILNADDPAKSEKLKKKYGL